MLKTNKIRKIKALLLSYIWHKFTIFFYKNRSSIYIIKEEILSDTQLEI